MISLAVAVLKVNFLKLRTVNYLRTQRDKMKCFRLKTISSVNTIIQLQEVAKLSTFPNHTFQAPKHKLQNEFSEA